MEIEKLKVTTKENELFVVDMRIQNFCKIFSRILEGYHKIEKEIFIF